MANFKKKLQDFFSVSTFAKLIVIAIIVITTIAPSLFDPEHANWEKVLSSFILSIVIIMCSFISQRAAAKKRGYEKDDYKASRKRHEDEYHLIQDRQLSHFHNLYVKDKNEKSKIERVKEIFATYEIPFDLFNCSLKDLKTAFSKGLVNKEQYSVIRLCRQGKIEYDKYDVRDLTTSRIIKKYRNSNKSQESEITWGNLLSKISWILALSIIWGMFVWDKAAAEEGFKNGQAWLDLASRLFTFVGGLYTGEVTGREICADDIRLYDRYFNFNSTFIQEFDNSLWKPSEEELEENILEKIHRLQKVEETDNLSQNSEIVVSEAKNSQNEEFEEVEMTEEEYKNYLEAKSIAK